MEGKEQRVSVDVAETFLFTDIIANSSRTGYITWISIALFTS